MPDDIRLAFSKVAAIVFVTLIIHYYWEFKRNWLNVRIARIARIVHYHSIIKKNGKCSTGANSKMARKFSSQTPSCSNRL